MQIDMHFYGVYALCRAVGIKAETARTIAYASQFVDDAIDAEAVMVSDTRALLPIMTSHRPIDYQNTLPGDQWRVWIPFHFLPGNKKGLSSSGTNARDQFIAKLVCRQDSPVAKKMILNSLAKKNKKFWPHLIGIAAHVYADTFSHSGFVGIANNWNKVKAQSIEIIEQHDPSILHYIWSKFDEFKTRFASDFAEIVPVGHAAVATFPDRPYLKWKFEYEDHRGNTKEVVRDNPSVYLTACERLYDFFSKFSQASPDNIAPHGPREWKKILPTLRALINYEAPKEKRVAKWKEAIAKGKFNKIDPIDKSINYDEGLWRPRRVAYEIRDTGQIQLSDTYRFMQAANEHLRYVIQVLLPRVGILA